jgi:hypothetical protein
MNINELRQTIHQEIDRLPKQVLYQILQIIQQINPPNLAEKSEAIQVTVEDDWSDLIGSIEIEENLSTTYKQVLSEGWAKKYDHSF